VIIDLTSSVVISSVVCSSSRGWGRGSVKRVFLNALTLLVIRWKKTSSKLGLWGLGEPPPGARRSSWLCHAGSDTFVRCVRGDDSVPIFVRLKL
jgi:hypothetical protein